MPLVGGPGGDDGLHPGRKRRWDDASGDVYRLLGPERPADVYVRAEPPPLPLSKRARIAEDEALFHADALPVHRRRSSLGSRVPARSAGALLAPCHICHRRPTKKSDLDSFAECQGCAGRTCFVCIRECHGWRADDAPPLPEHDSLSPLLHMGDVDDMPQDEPHEPPPLRHRRDGRPPRQHENRRLATDGAGWDACGHRAVICSRCCVEKGPQGDVCLGCLSGMPSA